MSGDQRDENAIEEHVSGATPPVIGASIDEEGAFADRTSAQRDRRDVDSEMGANLYQQSRRKGSLNEKLLTGDPNMYPPDAPDPMGNTIRQSEIRRSSLHDLVNREFYEREGWFDEFCEVLFKIKGRGTTIKSEIYFGIIHFISCFYCIAVVPQQLFAAGYDTKTTAVAVALCSGIGSIFCGLFANLPFVLAPPTVVSIFLSVFCRQNDLDPKVGNYGVMISGALLMLFYFRPIGDFIRLLIPLPIQVGTAVGIGLLTTLAGSTEIDLVETGEFRILRMGKLTVEIVIAFVGFFIICIAMRYHIIGSFCMAVIFCTIIYWGYTQDFPPAVASLPSLDTATFSSKFDGNLLPLLTGDLLFLYIMYMNGLVNSLSRLAVLTRDDGAIPRGRWVFVLSGVFTIVGGLLTSAPILVSPESSAAIKDGAKTGLSTVIAGVLFLFAVFFSPLFDHIPAAGTSPVLLMIGVILFQNVNRIDWRKVADAAPAFVVLFYIPFTYSIIQGVVLGYILYLAITLMTGELLENTLMILIFYFPSLESFFQDFKFLQPYLQHVPSAQSDAAKVQVAKAALAGRPARAGSISSTGDRPLSVDDNRPQGYDGVEDDSSGSKDQPSRNPSLTGAGAPSVHPPVTPSERARRFSIPPPNMLACASIDLDMSSIAEAIPAMQQSADSAGAYPDYATTFQRSSIEHIEQHTVGTNPMYDEGNVGDEQLQQRDETNTRIHCS